MGSIKLFWLFLGFLLAVFVLPVAAQTPLSVLPDEPEVLAVFGATPETVVTTTSTNQMDCFYDVSSPGTWSGGGFNWDDFTTPENEYGDLAPLTNIVFAIRGNPLSLKLELEDINTNKAAFYLINISNEYRTVNITSNILNQYFPDFNMARTRFFFFVAQPGDGNGNVGTGNEIGSFRVLVQGGFPFVYHLWPTSNVTLTQLGGNPRVIPVGGANPGTLLEQTNDSNFSVTYDVSSGGWSGATILFDNDDTGQCEYQDLTAFPSVVFGVTGSAKTLKFEIEDVGGLRMNAYLHGIPGGLRYYAIDTALIASRGVEVARTRWVNFVIDQPLAATATQAAFRVWSLGPALDTDGDHMPDHVERAIGLDPNDNTNGSGFNDDPDADGASNFDEMIAGTSPTNDAESLTLNLDQVSLNASRLSIDGAPGRRYRLYRCDNLCTSAWTQVGATVQPSVPGPVEFTLPPLTNDSPNAYTIRVTKD